MLEDKLKGKSSWLVALTAGIIGIYSCAPNLQVVSKYPGPNGPISTGYNCCSQLNCSSYDGCKSDGESWENSAWQEKCHCYSISRPSSSSNSSSSDHDHGGYDRGDRSDRGGHCEARSKH